MLALYVWIKNWLGSEEGQDLAEYALLVALIAIIVLVAVTIFGTNLNGFFNRIASTVSGWTSS